MSDFNAEQIPFFTPELERLSQKVTDRAQEMVRAMNARLEDCIRKTIESGVPASDITIVRFEFDCSVEVHANDEPRYRISVDLKEE